MLVPKNLICPTYRQSLAMSPNKLIAQVKIIITERSKANLVKVLLQLAASSRLRTAKLTRSRSMTVMCNETKTISLSLNFNNENQYHFSVKIPPSVDACDARYLTGVNSVGETFKLDGLGKVLMQLLVQLDHAKKKIELYDDAMIPHWELRAATKWRLLPAARSEVRTGKVSPATRANRLTRVWV